MAGRVRGVFAHDEVNSPLHRGLKSSAPDGGCSTVRAFRSAGSWTLQGGYLCHLPACGELHSHSSPFASVGLLWRRMILGCWYTIEFAKREAGSLTPKV